MVGSWLEDAIDGWTDSSDETTVDAAHLLMGLLCVLEPMVPLVETGGGGGGSVVLFCFVFFLFSLVGWLFVCFYIFIFLCKYLHY